ncbi:cupin domain-containing protein [Actinomadura sp. HBU206391]|uniref:cupin domain-containing protein n=1 Tax=Actinomadura sp. HBU206391 TaxID=2731692 RepID=UPI00164F133F|nr:cupin domain-containing protein [Actinomadura sp. HBU206391]MBC6456924.1 cupin domain-containing protein [Actinomadura sp. HBU206391]
MTTMRSEQVVHLDDVEPITWGGEEAARFLLRAEDTGGLYSFYEVCVPPGEGSLFHIHEDTDEALFVIDGEFEIRLDGDVHKAPSGVLVYGPRGVGHSFFNTWHRPSRMLCMVTPGGIERFFEELSLLMSQDSPPEWNRMRELAARHRIVAFRPQSDPHDGPAGGASSHLDQKRD